MASCRRRCISCGYLIASDGLAIGEIADRLGAERSMFHAGAVEVPPIHMVQSVGDAVVLAVPVDDLRQVLSPTSGREASPTGG